MSRERGLSRARHRPADRQLVAPTPWMPPPPWCGRGGTVPSPQQPTASGTSSGVGRKLRSRAQADFAYRPGKPSALVSQDSPPQPDAWARRGIERHEKVRMVLRGLKRHARPARQRGAELEHLVAGGGPLHPRLARLRVDDVSAITGVRRTASIDPGATGSEPGALGSWARDRAVRRRGPSPACTSR